MIWHLGDHKHAGCCRCAADIPMVSGKFWEADQLKGLLRQAMLLEYQRKLSAAEREMTGAEKQGAHGAELELPDLVANAVKPSAGCDAL